MQFRCLRMQVKIKKRSSQHEPFVHAEEFNTSWLQCRRKETEAAYFPPESLESSKYFNAEIAVLPSSIQYFNRTKTSVMKRALLPSLIAISILIYSCGGSRKASG